MRWSRCAISVSVSGSSCGEHFEDRLERAVAAGAVQPQLVAEPAALRELPAGREQRRQRAHRVGAAARSHRRRGFRDRARVRRPAVGQRLNQPGEIVALPIHFVFRVRRDAHVIVVMRPGKRRADFRGAERRDVDDLELRRRIAQQPVRARGVSAGQHEPVAARRERADQIAQHGAQPGEALERAQLEELVEQERRRRRAGRARRVEERERGVERVARARLGRRRRV